MAVDLKEVRANLTDAMNYDDERGGPLALLHSIRDVEPLADEVELLRRLLGAVIDAYNGNPDPVHYKVRKAINAAQRALADADDSE